MSKTAHQQAALARLARLQGGTPSALRTAESLVNRLQRLAAAQPEGASGLQVRGSSQKKK